MDEIKCDSIHHDQGIPLHDFESQLLVLEYKVLQVVTRTDGANKFIEDLIQQTNGREKIGTIEGVSSAQLILIKEEMERLKSDYL